ncbi:MAG: cyclophilin-like fold protein [Candidatus Korarchaeota archaeon]
MYAITESEYLVDIIFEKCVVSARIIRNYSRKLCAELEKKIPFTTMFTKREKYIEIPLELKSSEGQYVSTIPRGSIAFSLSKQALILAMDDIPHRSIVIGELENIENLNNLERGIVTIRRKE